MCAGIHIQTGEEVGIKLVRAETLPPARCVRWSAAWAAWSDSACATAQESVKTKHPQLLYESKLYKILQGGSKPRPAWSHGTLHWMITAH